jgi:hypothetical protein
MNASVFIIGILAVLCGWLLHFVWWNVSRPRDDLMALAFCMILLPALVVSGVFVAGCSSPATWILSLMIAVSVGMAYVFWYPAAQAASPTMLITIMAREAGEAGLTESALNESLTEDVLSGNSLQSLVGERFAEVDADGKLQLASRGKRTLSVIRMLRHSAGFEDPRG